MEITGHLLDIITALVIAIIVQIIMDSLGKIRRRMIKGKEMRREILRRKAFQKTIFRLISFILVFSISFLILVYLI